MLYLIKVYSFGLLTKKFEEVFVGTPAEVATHFGEKTKGEITLVLSPIRP